MEPLVCTLSLAAVGPFVLLALLYCRRPCERGNIFENMDNLFVHQQYQRDSAYQTVPTTTPAAAPRGEEDDDPLHQE